MTKLFQVDVKICGTAYIKADSAEEAQALLDSSYLDSLDDFLISDLSFDDPDLPEFSLSPAMTIYGRFTEDTPIEEVPTDE